MASVPQVLTKEAGLVKSDLVGGHRARDDLRGDTCWVCLSVWVTSVGLPWHQSPMRNLTVPETVNAISYFDSVGRMQTINVGLYNPGNICFKPAFLKCILFPNTNIRVNEQIMFGPK